MRSLVALLRLPVSQTEYSGKRPAEREGIGNATAGFNTVPRGDLSDGNARRDVIGCYPFQRKDLTSVAGDCIVAEYAHGGIIMTYKAYQWVRGILAAVLAIIGIVAIWLVADPSQGSLWNTFNKVAIIFWTVVPPAWFFFEYWIFDSEKLIKRPLEGTNQPVAKERFLKSLKDYADYASKIWAAILAVLVFLFGANMTSKQPSASHAREQGAYSSTARKR
jgi:hypothetical protein